LNVYFGDFYIEYSVSTQFVFSSCLMLDFILSDQ